jgi:3-dehydroquinate dehydratase-2
VRVAVLNGPNLNLLGRREPHVYGRETLADVEAALADVGRELGVEVRCLQRNGEGELIDAIHALAGEVDAILINAGAYTHTSLAIRDALVGVGLPYVEVHVSNVHAREPERHHSMLASRALAVLAGFGVYGYELGLRGLARALQARQTGTPAVAPAGTPADASRG